MLDPVDKQPPNRVREFAIRARLICRQKDSNITPNKQTRYRNGLSASSLTGPGDSTLDAVRTNQHHKADGLWSFALFRQEALIREVAARKRPLNINRSKRKQLEDISRLLSQVPQLQVDSAEMNSLAWLLNESDERKRKHKGDGCYQQDSNGINSGGPREGRSGD